MVKTKFLFKLIILCLLCTPAYSQEIPFGSSAEHGKVVKINGVDIYYETYGKGEPLLLLHGNRASISSFSLQIPEFSKYFQVIAMDSRGHGKTTDADTIITYELMARDVAALIDSLKLESVHIVGWSDGANVGLELAKAYPEKIKRMIMFAGNYKMDEHSVIDEKLYENLKNQLLNEDSIEWKLTNLLLHYPQLTKTDLQKIRIPILVMAGEHDLILEGHTREMQEYLPNSKLHIAKGATHMMPLEDSKSFNDVVLEYLLDNKPVKTISGKIVDHADRVLEYVNIGIPDTDFGTMSFRNGLFELDIPYGNLNDTLTFLHLGYEPLTMPIADMGSNETIVLFSKTYSLSEVTITANQPKRQKIGITMHNHFIGIVARHGEWAMLMKSRKLPAKIEKLNFHIASFRKSEVDRSNDSVYFRINFYAVTDSMPGENISGQSIVIKHLTQLGWNELDLRPFNVVMTENFFVGIEWLVDLDKKPNRSFCYGSVLLRPRSIYSRKTGLGVWNKVPGWAVSMNLEILY